MINFHENAWRCPKCKRWNSRCARWAENNPRTTKCRCGYKVVIETATKKVYSTETVLKSVKEK